MVPGFGILGTKASVVIPAVFLLTGHPQRQEPMMFYAGRGMMALLNAGENPIMLMPHPDMLVPGQIPV